MNLIEITNTVCLIKSNFTSHNQDKTSTSILHTAPKSDISCYYPFLFYYPDTFDILWPLALQYYPNFHLYFQPPHMVQSSHLMIMISLEVGQ